MNSISRVRQKRDYTPEQKRRWQLMGRYGLTVEQYDALLAKQEGKCPICHEPPRRPCVDHDHETDAVRGILCHRCNIGLPYVEEPAYRVAALAYLEQHVMQCG